MSRISEIELIERQTLTKLAQLKNELIVLKKLPVWDTHGQLTQQYASQLAQMKARHLQRKQERDLKRNQYRNTLQGEGLINALDGLKRESQQDGIEHRYLKQKRDQELAPFIETIAQTDQQIKQLKQQYTTLSQQWQAKMQTAYAAEQASSEIPPLPILYQDKALIVVDKPAGLLSVPGRRYRQQDSVLSRLRWQLPGHNFLQVAHRLDQATSGILVLAKSPSAHKALGQQFAQHQVCKTYEAILSCPITKPAGVIDLPLWSNPAERPRQSVNVEYGKPSLTHFEVLKTDETPRVVLQTDETPRVKFLPHTGRTHQLRVHAAHPQGLNSTILGDSLYGQPNQSERLHLHASSLEFVHPVSQKQVRFTSDTPF
ncbi:MAG: RluA family pseudouridine synthase [Cyanobacteria bacterium P01_A01_bin.137]